MAKADCGLTIGLVAPRPRGNIERKRLADFKVEPRSHWLAASQLPDLVTTASELVNQPAGW